MKISLLYTYFNGYEQLIESISAMHDLVDEIVICYQKTSNKGDYNPEAENDMRSISHKFSKVWLINWEPDLNLNTKQNERNKHNFMIQQARITGATHFILSACDHIYSKEHFKVAIDKMISDNLDICFTQMYTYYKNKNWRIEPIENYYMPFIHKMYPNAQISTCAYPVRVDPSVKINTCQWFHVFKPEECILHHYSMVRNDILDKFRNAAASIRWTPSQLQIFISEYENAKIGDKITYFQGAELVAV